MIDSIAFIGGGVMAEAMIGRLVVRSHGEPSHVVAAAVRKKRRVELDSRPYICTAAGNCHAAHGAGAWNPNQ